MVRVENNDGNIKKQPQVTVIMATYNAANYLEDCLAGLAGQSYSNFVVKIIDDASSDRTVDMLRHWCRADRRFQVVAVHRENRGLTVSLNELLKHCDTELVARMDADDISLPQRLENQVRYLTSHPELHVVGSWAYDIDETGRITGVRRVPRTPEEITRMLPLVNPLIHPTVMFRRKAICTIGGYNEKYRYAQDYELWFRCVAHNLILANIGEPLLKYRVSAGHAGKRGWRYRKLDAGIRWRGTELLGYSRPRRLIYAALPLALGVMPAPLKRIALALKDTLDPRQRQYS